MPVTYSEAITAEIRAEMGRQHVTAATLARRTGLSQPYLSRHLSGRGRWTIDDLQAIADALGIPLRALTVPAMKAGSS